jgi:hypothetical protein
MEIIPTLSNYTTVTVLNPLNDEETEVTLNLLVNLLVTPEGKKILSVNANGVVEL